MHEDRHPAGERLTRRSSLLKLGGAVAALGAGGWQARGLVDPATASAGPTAVASGLVTCVLTPEQTEGPYFLSGDHVRRNVVDGHAGVPLTLRLGVLDVSTCKPIKGAAVDIWHCDAEGIYSGIAQQDTVGKRFLRGIQKTNAKGVSTFLTIYPGWYQGRTVHIHTRVFLGGNIVHTGQLYFPDSVSDVVYTRAPYRSRPDRDIRNVDDSIYRNGGSKSVLRLARSGTGYVGSLTMGVQRS